jgi:DNA-binding NarL/FixJ family response regulator
MRAIEQAEARGLYRESLATLGGLLDLLPAEDSRWRDIVEVLDWQAEWVLSHLAENDAATAIAAMDRIRMHLDDQDPVAAATVALHRASLLSFGQGHLDEASEACEQARAWFEVAGDDTGILLSRNERAWVHGSAGQLLDQYRVASAVLDDAEAGGHLRAATQAAGTAAYAAGWLGRFDEAEDLFARAYAHAAATTNPYRVAWVHAQRGCMRSVSGRLLDGLDDVSHALEADHRAPDAIAYEDLAHCLWLAGRLDDALDALRRSAARRSIRGSRRRAWGVALAARLHLELGQPQQARSSLDVAADTYDSRHFLVWGLWHPWCAALLAWHDDGPSTAHDLLVGLASDLAAQGARPYEALVQADISDVAMDAADPRNAARAAARATALADAVGGALLDGLAALAQARANHIEGHHAEAAEQARQAAEHVGSAGYRLLHAQALDVRGRALADQDRELAIGALEQAAEAFGAGGAAWRRDRTLSELARLGSRGRRAAAAIRGPGALTARELEVATLAAQGLTAREIGERLFIGQRTVESHLSNCYPKLGITSKRELVGLADELRQAGLRPPPP